MLYQNVRPQTIDEIVGNDSTIGSLRVMIGRQPKDRPHAIIIKGPTGCGKTTIARILAKAFGSTDDSTFEYNAANTRGIETIRGIEETACLTALGGVAKTYILDESHQLTSQAQEALLKVMEDTGIDCYFIMCTTSPDSLIKTIRNRCPEYEVGPLSEAEIGELLTRVIPQCGMNVSKDIVDAISYTCEGSPRAALVSLEQVNGVEFDAAIELLVKGTPLASGVIDLCKMLIMYPEKRRERWNDILLTFHGIGEDNEVIRRSIMTFLYNRLRTCTSMEDASDITRLMTVFSTSTFYGGKPALGALIAKACLGV